MIIAMIQTFCNALMETYGLNILSVCPVARPSGEESRDLPHHTTTKTANLLNRTVNVLRIVFSFIVFRLLNLMSCAVEILTN
jgi:hypothetical protein